LVLHRQVHVDLTVGYEAPLRAETSSSTTLSLLNAVEASNNELRIKNLGRKLFSSPRRDMPRPLSSKAFASKAFANVIYLFPTLVHCSTCDVLQPMHINGVQPALYCGKNTVFYQCTKGGNETTERVATQ
jgi:hypothetical protein